MMTENNLFLSVLCVDAVENDIPRGRFYYGDLVDAYPFSSMDRFLMALGELLAGRESGIPAVERENEAVWLPGKVATFRIQIKYCRNENWQGSVMWLETRHEEYFRSELELLSIMRQALIPAEKQRMCPSSLKTVKQIKGVQ